MGRKKVTELGFPLNFCWNSPHGIKMIAVNFECRVAVVKRRECVSGVMELNKTV